jgi:ketosteroid isomerase-like protein
VSEENVELVRAGLRAWNGQDQDAMLQLFSTDVEIDASDRVLNPDAYVGLEGFIRFRDEIAEAWDRFEVEIEEVFDAGDQVLVFVRSSGRGRGSGAEAEFRSAWLVTVSDRKIVRLRLYRDREESLQAAGLSE